MKKLAIVCGSPSTEMTAPFDNDKYEIWALAMRQQNYSRYDRLFEIHDDLTHHGNVTEYCEYITNLGVPVVVGKNFPCTRMGEEYKNTTVFPFDEVNKMFGYEYLTSSCAYMLSMAILEGYKHIEIYGVDLGVDDNEYFYQRPCFEAWCGFAKGKGITVIIPEKSSCLKASFTYGVDKLPLNEQGVFSEAELMKMAGFHAQKIAQAENQIEQLNQIMLAHDGSRQVYEKLAQVSRAVASGQKLTNLNDSISIV